ncbi:MAG: phenylalanine 4-monooxygenase [Gammaproteobacteria bacterium]|nr:phenylalanine 4-monooxygenase [Gammaproteobacteria bacterium]
MKFVSRYESHPTDDRGYVSYRQEEHDVWRFLYERQIQIVEHRAVDEFILGLKKLDLSAECIPQIPDLNLKLAAVSSWQLAPVSAVIPPNEFFGLLASHQFPVATFIRRQEDIDYITEPDVFHEIFGHIPLLTNAYYAEFVSHFAKIALSHPKEDWYMFLRLFWFTIEFGLIETTQGLRIYGGGILSSYAETLSALTTDASIRAYFDPISALRTPYRIDLLQSIYYVIKDFSLMYDLCQLDYTTILKRVRELGMWAPLYEPKMPT